MGSGHWLKLSGISDRLARREMPEIKEIMWALDSYSNVREFICKNKRRFPLDVSSVVTSCIYIAPFAVMRDFDPVDLVIYMNVFLSGSSVSLKDADVKKHRYPHHPPGMDYCGIATSGVTASELTPMYSHYWTLMTVNLFMFLQGSTRSALNLDGKILEPLNNQIKRLMPLFEACANFVLNDPRGSIPDDSVVESLISGSPPLSRWIHPDLVRCIQVIEPSNVNASACSGVEIVTENALPLKNISMSTEKDCGVLVYELVLSKLVQEEVEEEEEAFWKIMKKIFLSGSRQKTAASKTASKLRGNSSRDENALKDVLNSRTSAGATFFVSTLYGCGPNLELSLESWAASAAAAAAAPGNSPRHQSIQTSEFIQAKHLLKMMIIDHIKQAIFCLIPKPLLDKIKWNKIAAHPEDYCYLLGLGLRSLIVHSLKMDAPPLKYESISALMRQAPREETKLFLDPWHPNYELENSFEEKKEKSLSISRFMSMCSMTCLPVPTAIDAKHVAEDIHGTDYILGLMGYFFNPQKSVYEFEGEASASPPGGESPFRGDGYGGAAIPKVPKRGKSGNPMGLDPGRIPGRGQSPLVHDERQSPFNFTVGESGRYKGSVQQRWLNLASGGHQRIDSESEMDPSEFRDQVGDLELPSLDADALSVSEMASFCDRVVLCKFSNLMLRPLSTLFSLLVLDITGDSKNKTETTADSTSSAGTGGATREDLTWRLGDGYALVMRWRPLSAASEDARKWCDSGFKFFGKIPVPENNSEYPSSADLGDSNPESWWLASEDMLPCGVSELNALLQELRTQDRTKLIESGSLARIFHAQLCVLEEGRRLDSQVFHYCSAEIPWLRMMIRIFLCGGFRWQSYHNQPSFLPLAYRTSLDAIFKDGSQENMNSVLTWIDRQVSFVELAVLLYMMSIMDKAPYLWTMMDSKMLFCKGFFDAIRGIASETTLIMNEAYKWIIAASTGSDACRSSSSLISSINPEEYPMLAREYQRFCDAGKNDPRNVILERSRNDKDTTPRDFFIFDVIGKSLRLKMNLASQLAIRPSNSEKFVWTVVDDIENRKWSKDTPDTTIPTTSPDLAMAQIVRRCVDIQLKLSPTKVCFDPIIYRMMGGDPDICVSLADAQIKSRYAGYCQADLRPMTRMLATPTGRELMLFLSYMRTLGAHGRIRKVISPHEFTRVPQTECSWVSMLDSFIKMIVRDTTVIENRVIQSANKQIMLWEVMGKVGPYYEEKVSLEDFKGGTPMETCISVHSERYRTEPHDGQVFYKRKTEQELATNSNQHHHHQMMTMLTSNHPNNPFNPSPAAATGDFSLVSSASSASFATTASVGASFVGPGGVGSFTSATAASATASSNAAQTNRMMMIDENEFLPELDTYDEEDEDDEDQNADLMSDEEGGDPKRSIGSSDDDDDDDDDENDDQEEDYQEEAEEEAEEKEKKKKREKEKKRKRKLKQQQRKQNQKGFRTFQLRVGMLGQPQNSAEFGSWTEIFFRTGFEETCGLNHWRSPLERGMNATNINNIATEDQPLNPLTLNPNSNKKRSSKLKVNPIKLKSVYEMSEKSLFGDPRSKTLKRDSQLLKTVISERHVPVFSRYNRRIKINERRMETRWGMRAIQLPVKINSRKKKRSDFFTIKSGAGTNSSLSSPPVSQPAVLISDKTHHCLVEEILCIKKITRIVKCEYCQTPFSPKWWSVSGSWRGFWCGRCPISAPPVPSMNLPCCLCQKLLVVLNPSTYNSRVFGDIGVYTSDALFMNSMNEDELEDMMIIDQEARERLGEDSATCVPTADNLSFSAATNKSHDHAFRIFKIPALISGRMVTTAICEKCAASPSGMKIMYYIPRITAENLASCASFPHFTSIL